MPFRPWPAYGGRQHVYEVTVMLKQTGSAESLCLDCVVEIFHKPKKAGGEDAFAYHLNRQALHAQAVFDGCGGSGAWKYAEYRNATGAFIAAHSMAKAFLTWFDTVTPNSLNEGIGTVAESFRKMAKKTLSDLKKQCAPMRVLGSLVKNFPCTASISFVSQKDGHPQLSAFNAGDSRVYILFPSKGLIQLTTDDLLGNPDPLENLRDSAPHTNQLDADSDFVINTLQLEMPLPCAVLCATDGAFGYVRSPMDFVFMLLDELMHANSFSAFEESLTARIAATAGDDVTCLMSFYGWGGIENVKRLLTGRYQYIVTIIRKLDSAMETDRFEDVLETVWNEYKKQTLYSETWGHTN